MDQYSKQVFISNSSSDDKPEVDDKRDIDQYLTLETGKKKKSSKNKNKSSH
jgi:hypothetical protein